MKKWQELAFNALMNFGVALMAGGVLKLALDNQSVVSSFITTIAGIYILFIATLAAKTQEERS